jgi:hypothetical protein
LAGSCSFNGKEAVVKLLRDVNDYMKKHALVLVSLVGLVLGCEPCPHYNRIQATSIAGTPIKKPSPDKKPYGTVKLFQDKAEVSRAYDVIGLMTLEGSAGDEARFITAFLYRGADMGADGVILYRGTPMGVASTGPWGIQMNTVMISYRGEAIRFK